MKGILIAFESTHFPEDPFDFSGRMHKLNPVLLSDKFPLQADYASLWDCGDIVSGRLSISSIEIAEDQKIEANIARFERLCRLIESRLK